MTNIVFNRCCKETHSGFIKNGDCFLKCPKCGREMFLFPLAVTERLPFSRERLVKKEAIDQVKQAAKKWNEFISVKEEVNG